MGGWEALQKLLDPSIHMLRGKLGGLCVDRHTEPQDAVGVPHGVEDGVAELLLRAQRVKDRLLHQHGDHVQDRVLPYIPRPGLVVVRGIIFQ